ncbi:MAG TPA: 23S rRNA (pseudouridine(1915)-N(3))-methyltransferase RlmH [Bacteroidales bacterium]|nr:23S rRNA (pseudouridine(1915)-N(3))-methyltransferase RlmH [Bacteroidales bacterium]
MKITLLLTGKTEVVPVRELMEDYCKRLAHYVNFEIVATPEIKNIKNLSIEQYKQKESEIQKKYLVKSDFIVLLDEFGKEYTSEKFAQFLEHKTSIGIKNLTFVVGGAYGFSEEIKQMAHAQLSLSKMTFPHQLVRLIFIEQLYRAFTIIRKEKYHHS